MLVHRSQVTHSTEIKNSFRFPTHAKQPHCEIRTECMETLILHHIPQDKHVNFRIAATWAVLVTRKNQNNKPHSKRSLWAFCLRNNFPFSFYLFICWFRSTCKICPCYGRVPTGWLQHEYVYFNKFELVTIYDVHAIFHKRTLWK